MASGVPVLCRWVSPRVLSVCVEGLAPAHSPLSGWALPGYRVTWTTPCLVSQFTRL